MPPEPTSAPEPQSPNPWKRSRLPNVRAAMILSLASLWNLREPFGNLLEPQGTFGSLKGKSGAYWSPEEPFGALKNFVELSGVRNLLEP